MTTQKGIAVDASGTRRCWWCGDDPLYVAYHDHEWGRPVTDDRLIFEAFCLDAFQAGLSWITILRKRDNFRRAFKDFNIDAVARFTKRDINRLLADASIVRNRMKIEAAINNAKQAPALISEFGSLWNYLRQYQSPDQPPPRRVADIPAANDASVALSKDLKRRGWSFVGPTIMYAMMQAIGLVNDHLDGCHVREAAERARQKVAQSSHGT